MSVIAAREQTTVASAARRAPHISKSAPGTGAGTPRRRRWWPGALQLGTHLASLVPFAWLLWDGAHNHLTVNPIQEITFRTGRHALVLLVLSLAVTPATRIAGWRWAVPLRRPLGLYGFFYATLHMLTFSVLDYGLDWGLILQAIREKIYILVGVGAYLLLIPLAFTSTKGWQRRLGRRWRTLHWLVYLAVPLAVLHFYLLVKADVREPLRYGAYAAVLLSFRLPPLRRALARLHGRLRPPART